MKPRHRATGEPRSSAASERIGGSLSNSFSIDARIGHAWFARSEKTVLPIKRPETLPALRRAELVLAGQGRAIARRATRIPADAIVALGAALAPQPQPALPEGAAAQGIANDNVADSGGRARTLLREMFFLLVFGATLAGTYYLGRLHAAHNIIVVPEPGSRAAKIV